MFFFFNDTATTEIYTLSLHDALPISRTRAPLPSRARPGFQPSAASTPAARAVAASRAAGTRGATAGRGTAAPTREGRCGRSEEHTSELQSRQYLVCRLLLEKKKRADD